MTLEEKMVETEARIVKLVNESTGIMIKKNRERTDAWKGSGLFGQFIEIYSMYMRLKVLIWDGTYEISDSQWIRDVRNALVDMRNFTILAELCLDDGNLWGDPEIAAIKCSACGEKFTLRKRKWNTKSTERQK